MKDKEKRNPRGDVIMEAAEAGLDAIINVLDKHGDTTLAEVSCISTLLRDMLMDSATSCYLRRQVDELT